MTLKAISVINTTCRPSKCREVAVQMYDAVRLNGCVYVGLDYLKLQYVTFYRQEISVLAISVVFIMLMYGIRKW